ncbi:MAG: site-2 protease family protein, partial [Halobacteriales archaeon]
MVSLSWTWVLYGFLVYWALVVVLDRRGVLERYDVSAAGPMLMVRTQRGKRLLDRVARHRRFWRAYGNVGVLLAGFVMVLSLYFVLRIGYISVFDTPEPTSLTEPRNVLVVPGVNDFLPLSMTPEIVLGLLVAIVAHEAGHGVLCRAQDIGVSSMGGVFLAALPMGAFVEPDDDEVEEASPAARTRMFSAGVMANFVLTVVFFVALAALAGAVTPVGGVGVQFVEDGSAADEAGVQQGDVVRSIDGGELSSYEDYVSEVEETRGEVVLGITRDGEDLERTIELDASEGVRISEVEDGEAADEAGLRADDVLVSVGGREVENVNDLQEALSGTSEGDEVEVEFERDGERRTVSAVLGAHPVEDVGFLGVNHLTRSEEVGLTPYDVEGPLSLLASYDPVDWVLAVFLPLGLTGSRFFGFDGFVMGFYELEGAAAAFGGVYWFALNALYWSAWVNFNLGLFNCIPALPLDGGHVFREAVGRGLSYLGGLRESTQDMVADAVSVAVAVLLFGSMVLMVAAPRLL